MIQRILYYSFRFAVALAAAFVAAAALVPAAYAQRGYSAIGGEWLLVLLIFGLVLGGSGRR